MPVLNGNIQPLAPEHISRFFGPPDNVTKYEWFALPPFTHNTRLHPIAGVAIRRALVDIADAGLAHLLDVRDVGDAYRHRNARGTRTPSAHSYGIALDLNCRHFARGRFDNRAWWRRNEGCAVREVPHSMRVLAPYFNAYGLAWGGHALDRHLRPSHIEATELTYAWYLDGWPRGARPTARLVGYTGEIHGALPIEYANGLNWYEAAGASYFEQLGLLLSPGEGADSRFVDVLPTAHTLRTAAKLLGRDATAALIGDKAAARLMGDAQ